MTVVAVEVAGVRVAMAFLQGAWSPAVQVRLSPGQAQGVMVLLPVCVPLWPWVSPVPVHGC